MTPIASGRIAVWEGGSLWAFDVPPGDSDRNQLHAHHALQVTFALEGGAFKLHLRDRIATGDVVIVAADAAHAFEAEGAVGLLFVAPESRAGRVLAKLLDGAPAVAADQLADAAPEIEAAFRAQHDPLSAMREAGQQLTARLAGAVRTIEPDRRVRQMIDWAGDNLDTALSAKEAAAHVGLSVSRASHLFVEQTGLPFRTFVLWLRVMRAVDAYGTGSSLTAAAQEAGFADSAHLSRTFRRMFGLSAAALEMS
jgi:AraC family transcriptional regulator